MDKDLQGSGGRTLSWGPEEAEGRGLAGQEDEGMACHLGLATASPQPSAPCCLGSTQPGAVVQSLRRAQVGRPCLSTLFTLV